MKTELKPCPFCGSNAGWVNEALADGHFYIRCENGFCSVTIKADRRDKAVGLWNARTHTSERLDHLRQRLEAKQEQLYTKHGNLFSAGQDSAFEEAISLIDQLKAETKNT